MILLSRVGDLGGSFPSLWMGLLKRFYNGLIKEVYNGNLEGCRLNELTGLSLSRLCHKNDQIFILTLIQTTLSLREILTNETNNSLKAERRSRPLIFLLGK